MTVLKLTTIQLHRISCLVVEAHAAAKAKADSTSGAEQRFYLAEVESLVGIAEQIEQAAKDRIAEIERSGL